MKFSKSRNPRKKTARRSPYSAAYIEERRRELDELLAKAKSDDERDMLIKAYSISINP